MCVCTVCGKEYQKQVRRPVQKQVQVTERDD